MGFIKLELLKQLREINELLTDDKYQPRDVHATLLLARAQTLTALQKYENESEEENDN